jgi:large subunit ribosomal protein L28
MARRCKLTGTGVQSGNKVSHSNRKTRRRFLPNLRHTSLLSETLGKPVSLRITAAALRTIEHHGGLDAYLLATANSKLPEEAQKLKRQIKKAAKSA